MSKHLRLNRRSLTKRHLLGSKLSKPELKNETGRCLASLLAHLAAAPAVAVALLVSVVVISVVVVVVIICQNSGTVGII